MENESIGDLPIQTVIVHSYVKLAEGTIALIIISVIINTNPIHKPKSVM